MGPIRLLIRLPFVLLHLLLGTPAAVISFYPPFRGIRIEGEPLHDHMLRWWARTVCRIFGVRIRPAGKLLPGPCLVVANHISWIDIQILHSLAPMGFVGKAEIEGWPVAGFVARVGGTVFHRRGSHDSAHGVASAMRERLAAGGKVAIFPEGGILQGSGIKRFHGRLFAAAVDTGLPVQPVMIRYIVGGRISEEMTFLDGEGHWANLVRLLQLPLKTAEVEILQPIATAGEPRKALAQLAEDAVRQAYDAEVESARV